MAKTSSASPYKAFVIGASVGHQQALVRAFAWLASAPPLASPALLLVPTKDQLTSSMVASVIGESAAKALAGGKAVSLGTRQLVAATSRTLERLRWAGGPILALWVDDEALDRLHGRPGISAVCALEWANGDLERWIRMFNPADPSNGQPAAPLPVRLDPVVVAALKAVTSSVNLSSGLAHPLDRDTAVHAFCILRDAGYGLDSADIHVWATQNNWRPGGATSLAEVAAKVAARKRLSTTRASSWTDDILEQWRAQASSATRSGS